LSDILKGFILN